MIRDGGKIFGDGGRMGEPRAKEKQLGTRAHSDR